VAQRPLSVVVTGGSAGVGRATALRFARAGARVAIIARSQSGLDATAREIEAIGDEVAPFALDVSDARALFSVADEIAQRWDGVDIWINNAMATMFAPVARMTCEEYARITNVTYLGYVYGTMAALKHMRPPGAGVIVQVGSALAYRAIPLQSAYCGAKFAIRAFTDALRSELIHDGSAVRLTMVQLPAVNTPQFDWARNRMGRRPRPLPPVFEPEDIAEIVYRAAHETPRETWVGAPTLKVIAGGVATPAYLDRYLAKQGYDGQFTREADDPAKDGNLFVPRDGEHAVRGRFSSESKPRPFAFNPFWLRVGAAAALAALLLYAVVLTVIVLG
jgi:NADP-dependent 3-hydroxy acid dehydrogenase YdfG